MAIEARANGLLIAVSIIEETDTYWLVKALDRKRPNKVMKGDPDQKVFDDCDKAMKWQDARREEKKNEPRSRRPERQ